MGFQEATVPLPSATMALGERLRVMGLPPFLVWLATATVYLTVLGPRIAEQTPDAHFVHLANSLLHGQLSVVGNHPLGQNDWACFDTETGEGCPRGALGRASGGERYRWYVSFPPFPAVVIAPLVTAVGTKVPDRAFWAGFAGLGPAMLFLLLEGLRRRGRTERRRRDNLLLTGLFAFGSVYFFSAVQGTVWFAAHVVATPLIALYLLFSLDARRPLLAGLMLGLCFLTRPTTAFLVPFFFLEACRVARFEDEGMRGAAPRPIFATAWHWFRAVRWRSVLVSGSLFAGPILCVGIVAMAMNWARFDHPFEFGHSYLQIVWRDRIERWGLFNYHYFAKNLSVFVAGLPWLSAVPPHVKISGHGLALWFTTPALLWVFFPKKPWTASMVALALAATIVALLDLCYQNSGWVQFGYRFALDYLPLLFVLLALGGRRFGPGFAALAAFAVVVNTFGAMTFDRAGVFYDSDPTQNVLFQPD